jgi:hypothetical protein
VAKQRTRPPELHRLGELLHPSAQVRAADRRRRLRAQREAATALVLESEHLLADDVGGAANAAGEEVGLLERRRLDPAVPGALEQLAGEVDHVRTPA